MHGSWYLTDSLRPERLSLGVRADKATLGLFGFFREAAKMAQSLFYFVKQSPLRRAGRGQPE